MRSIRTISRLAAAAILGVAALSLSVTDADAGVRTRHSRAFHRVGHHHHHGACALAHTHPRAFVVRPVMIPRPVIVVTPPVTYGTVVYDHGRVGVDGFIGISGPHLSVAIGF